MGIKFRQALEAAQELLDAPLDAGPTGKLFDAFAEFWVIEKLYDRMMAGVPPERAARLRRLTGEPLDEAALMALPERSFGHRYAVYMRDKRYHLGGRHSDFPPVNEAFEKNWIMHRFAKVHDLAHVLLGFDVDPPAEVGMQLFHLRNFGEPWGAVAVASLPLILARRGQPRATLAAMRRALRLGAEAENVLTAPLEEWLEDDLDAVRRRLNIVL